MDRYEYCLASYQYARYRRYTFGGESVIADDASKAKVVFGPKLQSGALAHIAAREMEAGRHRAEHEAEMAVWTKRQDHLVAETKIEAYDEEVKKGGRFSGTETVHKERVTLPGGRKKVVRPGRGAASIERGVRQVLGPPPVLRSMEVIPTEAEAIDELWQEVDEEEVGAWNASIRPADPSFDDAVLVGSVTARSVGELNRLGALGWRVIEVSEDRGVYEGPEGNDAAQVIGVRYLLMRTVAG